MLKILNDNDQTLKRLQWLLYIRCILRQSYDTLTTPSRAFAVTSRQFLGIGRRQSRQLITWTCHVILFEVGMVSLATLLGRIAVLCNAAYCYIPSSVVCHLSQ